MAKLPSTVLTEEFHRMIAKRKSSGPLFVIGGHDPSGAGIQADIETAAAFKVRTNSLVTALTVQNTSQVEKIETVNHHTLKEQIACLVKEHVPLAVKVGLIPDKEIAFIVSHFLKTLSPNTPIVIDPVIRSGSDVPLVQKGMDALFVNELFPNATMVTPNFSEATNLTGRKNLEAAANILLESGCESVLVTDTEPSDRLIKNILFQSNGNKRLYSVKRKLGRYHGTGCTLATAIACGLCEGWPLERAVGNAIEFTSQAVYQAEDHGLSQRIPNRIGIEKQRAIEHEISQ